ncbi:esterase-5B-like isoform X2 [Condylostylus longicornis]|uniref:esterase-5B-like isoform X2 n=1 Tax=Condylostylus longicornis TaxID=2530218 RepID=UPI00244E5631|nr:esterase-5B-like isoform X2 [Condylostylus longicornis]
MILLSGTAIAPYNEPTVNPAKQVYHLAEYCGIKNASQLSTFEVVKKLKEIDAETLIQAADYFHTNGIDPVVVFKIVLENPESKTAFITKHPKELSKTGKYYYVPILTGILENDGSVRTMSMRNNDTEIKRFNTDFNDNLAVLLAVENNDDVLGKIIDYYLKGERNLNNMTFNNFEKVVSDRAFMYPFYDAVLDLLEFSDKSLILYKFDKKVSASFSKVYTSDYIDSSTSGPVHGDDLLELFYFKTKKFNLKTNDSIDNSPFFDYIIKFITDEPMENFDVCTQEEMISKLKQNKICSYRNFGDIVELRDSFRVEDAKFWDKLLKVREN